MKFSTIVFLLLNSFNGFSQTEHYSEFKLKVPYENKFLSSTEFYRDAAIALTLSLGAHKYDKRIYTHVERNKNSNIENTVKNFRFLGKGEYLLAMMGTAYYIGYLNNSELIKESSFFAFESFVYAGVAVTLVKQLAHRHRPYRGDGPNKWDGPEINLQGSRLSFYSGDATTAFSTATVVATYWQDVPVVPILAYSAASLTAYARVNDGYHWASDVLVGSFVGYFIGKKVVAMHFEKEKNGLPNNQNTESVRDTVLPIVSQGTYGINWTRDY